MNKKLPDITLDFNQWYNEIVYDAGLADLSPVKGSIVIMPYGYAIWENIQNILDKKIKETGHSNCYFPLLIPQSFLAREAQHVEGFAPEVAVVNQVGGKQLEEPLVIRPTSETMIHYMFAKWIKSWRDLPLKINQWANVVRWEMRTRPFLRTTEFLWQEGHTAHETQEEAKEEAELMLAQYVDVVQNFLAVPVVAAKKPDSERFAGADVTYTIEGLMQDGKALQMGTSHLISQNFAKAFGMTFQDRNGSIAHPFLTSWGITTRLIGAVVMIHGDNKGLVLPPKIAPIQVVIVPIFKTESKDQVLCFAKNVESKLKEFGIRTHLDDQDDSPGSKFYKWELKGVPIRIEIGPRDIEKNSVVVVFRVDSQKREISVDRLAQVLTADLNMIQQVMFKSAYEKRKLNWHKVKKIKDFATQLEKKGGFYQTGWCRNLECENIAKQNKATIRCVLEENSSTICFACEKASLGDIIIAKAY